MGERVLLGVTDPTLGEALERELVQQGYVVHRATGEKALEDVRRERPDVVVLELEAGPDRFAPCRALRAETPAPVLLIATSAAEEERIAGLEAGADDYLARPFSTREFLVRIRALLRRARLSQAERDTAPAPPPDEELTIDAERREVRRNGRVLHLKPREFDLLAFLSRHPGVAHSRQDLLRAVWGREGTVGTRTVDVHICWLRDKIEANPGRPRRIVTVRGFGYRFDE